MMMTFAAHCCAEVPSFSHEQHLSPDTAGSHIAANDESLARVKCRAQWRQHAQTPPLQSVEEVGWMLRSITIGKPCFTIRNDSKM